MTHILNIITAISFVVLFIICGYFVTKAKDVDNVNDEYDYTLKADVCLACVVIILMFRLLIMYLYK